jgi:coenzyme F420 hydrogenase subunit beta
MLGERGMRQPGSLKTVVRNGLCVGCGACASAGPGIQLELNTKRGVFEPELSAYNGAPRGNAFLVCPGRGYDIEGIAEQVFPEATERAFELGRYLHLYVGQSKNPSTLTHASSGGVMTEVSLYLLKRALVDGVCCCKMDYTDRGPTTNAFIAHTPADVLAAQGSKYCPTNLNSLVADIDRCKRYLFVGLPCQVAALRLQIQHDPALGASFPYIMSSFCGGIRPFTWTYDIIRHLNLNPGQVRQFRYRGGGQPGSLHLTTAEGVRVSYSYPAYEALSRIPKLRRCSCCIDATAELADLACGDAWLDKWLDTGRPWSILIARSSKMANLIKEMAGEGLLDLHATSKKDVIASQQSNIDSKKFRQYKRLRIYSALGFRVPSWQQPLPRGDGSYTHEAWILFRKSSVGLFAWRMYQAFKRAWRQ